MTAMTIPHPSGMPSNTFKVDLDLTPDLVLPLPDFNLKLSFTNILKINHNFFINIKQSKIVNSIIMRDGGMFSVPASNKELTMKR